MSEKKNTKPKKHENESAEGKKKLGKKGILTIVIASLALVGIITGIIVAIAVNKNKEFDYSNTNLSKYVTVPEKLYKSYNVTLNIPEITDFDVEEDIVKMLCLNKITPDGPIYSIPGQIISAGDIVQLYYRGYTEENGAKVYFDGGCNFASDPAKTALEIGSGTFIPGFESGLIGESGVGCATLERATSGVVKAGDIVNLTYSIIRPGGASQKDQTVLLDLSDPTLDERWGDGFTEYLIGKQIGTEEEDKFATGKKGDEYLILEGVNGTDGDVVYLDMNISVACRVSDGERLVIEAYFPNDYKAEDLEGKTAYFEVYIQSVRDYITPELNDAFITDTLKFTAEDLSIFEGDTLVDKYKAYLKAVLNEEREANIKYAIEDAFWEQLMAGVEFKKLPESEVQKYYDMAIADLTALFESGYGSYFNNDFDTFARYYLELSSTADWQAVIRADAEESVKRRIAFYYIIREEKFAPNEEEYNEIYEFLFADHVQKLMEEKNITEEAAKKEVLESYSDVYWEESVLYDYAIAKMLERAIVTFE